MLTQVVQIQDAIALIDSRDYCSEILGIDHNDWMNNIIYKYRSVIESTFGVLRFQNVIALGANGGRPSKYALLTEPQCNFCLALSKNNSKTIQKKAELIAAFEEAKAIIRAQLERSLSLTIADVPGYTHTLDSLWKDSGIVSKYQVANAIKRDFEEGTHYYFEGEELHISEVCYQILMISFRSKKGINPVNMPIMLKISTEELYQYEQRKKANTRNPKKCDDYPALF